MTENGELKKPTIIIEWDEANQRVGLAFDITKFKTWEFISAVLKMADLWVEENRSLAISAKIQKQNLDNARVQALLNQHGRAS